MFEPKWTWTSKHYEKMLLRPWNIEKFRQERWEKHLKIVSGFTEAVKTAFEGLFTVDSVFEWEERARKQQKVQQMSLCFTFFPSLMNTEISPT